MSQTPMGMEPGQGAGVPPLAYQVAGAVGGFEARDAGHLMALSICHYVFGGMTILFSSIFIIHIVMGLAIVSGKLPMTPMQPPMQPMGAPTGMPTTQSMAAAQFNQSMSWVGWIFVIMGSCAVGIGWTIGILAIFSGVCIARRRKRTFSLVVAGISCMAVPLGTVLGIFTFLVLLRESVKRVYGMQI